MKFITWLVEDVTIETSCEMARMKYEKMRGGKLEQNKPFRTEEVLQINLAQKKQTAL